MNNLKRRWRRWSLKYTTLLIVSLVVFFLAARTPQATELLHSLSAYGRWGAFLAGAFFVSAYTAVPAAFVLFELGNYLHPVQIALIGGLGAMIGDYVIFRFVRDQLTEELKPHFRWLRWLHRPRKRQSLLLKVLMPTIGAIIIISPFPDEIGVGLMGLARMNKLAFLVLTYFLNAIGIFILAAIARTV